MFIMKNLKILLIFLLFPLLCLGQAKYNSGEVTYGVDLDIILLKEEKSSNEIGQQYLEKVMNDAKQSAAAITCVLKFNPSIAHFFAEEILESDAGRGYKLALSQLDIDGPYYVDLTKKEILQEKEAFGKIYLVEEEFGTKREWSVSSESKHIGKYKVYKASTVKVVENSKGTFESEVIAWFAPEIPFNFGPVGYGGLPGLILELEVKSNFPVRYFAKTIDFNREEINIDVPSNTKRITAKELDEMYRKAMGNMREFSSGNSGN